MLTPDDIIKLGLSEVLQECNAAETFISNLYKIMTKKWYQSTTVWFNVLVTVIGVATSLQGVATFDKYAQILGTVVVVGNVILRVWFTNTAILATPNSPTV